MNCQMPLWPLVFEILCLQILITQCEKIYDPTLKPFNPFSANLDADVLKREFDNNIPNGDNIAKLWFHRTYQQRMQIRDCISPHLESYLQDISDQSLDDLYSDTFLSPEGLLGQTAHEVFMGKWNEVGAIEEVLCGNDKDTKDLIADYYKNTHGDTLENHLTGLKKEDQEYQHVLQQYCWKGLCQDKKITPEDAAKEAKALRDIDPRHDAKKFKIKLNELLDKNCEPDMKLIFEKYRQDDNGIVQTIEKAFDGKMVERAYNRLVRYIEDTCKFYADELEEAVDGWGTDTDRINRIVVSRCERDLGCILKKYEEMHGKTFTQRLKSDVLGEPRYCKSIRYLCGKT